MRNGMAAWMGSMLDRAPDTQAATLISDARLSAGIEQNLINIVASMTLTTVGENMP